ncbi:MAG: NADH-quinone oxidoreductase chain 5 [Alphaproteobacteria bacterium MarineAlpha3_Bin7]|nr:MAG: NADH-quinone oxidoreductase chain 5 [Alphaproteobacteria bacterium MarineAlpha3_Bin7]
MSDLQEIESVAESIRDGIGAIVKDLSIVGDQLVAIVEKEDIAKLLLFLRDDVNCQFKQLMDICGVDYPERPQRFEVVYNLLSLVHNNRVTVKVMLDDNSSIPSVSKVFSSADWWEREIWDLFGIFFSGHPDLRRILTDYGFDGHPLRKDFPLTGYVEVRYDDAQKRVVYEPVKLTQEYRDFDFLSPWEGMNINKDEIIQDVPDPKDGKLK